MTGARKNEKSNGVAGSQVVHVADWRHELPKAMWDPGPQLIRCIRRCQHYRQQQGVVGRMLWIWWACWHRFWSVATGCDIRTCTRIGAGLRIPHANGIIVHPNVQIGANCTIMQQVTLGMRRADDLRVPVVGNAVEIGAGAKILGGVRIGDGAHIGANAVVLQDVPPGMTAVGIPARTICDVPQGAEPAIEGSII